MPGDSSRPTGTRRIELHALAEADIVRIAEYGAFHFGVRQATLYHRQMIRQFELLAEFPDMGRPLQPFRPDLYRFGYGRHVIIYAVRTDAIEIRRVMHDRMDLAGHIEKL